MEGKKVYLPPSQAGEFERVSKTPRSTRFGRPNPIAAKCNSEAQLILWRESWAQTTNRHLENMGIDARIDHRTIEEQGIPDMPTIHEGVTARAMEREGKGPDRCELNLQIKAGNQILQSIRRQIEKWEDQLKSSIPVVAEALEGLRDQMILQQYEFLRNRGQIRTLFQKHTHQSELLKEYRELKAVLKEKTGQRRDLTEEIRAEIRQQHKREVRGKIRNLFGIYWNDNDLCSAERVTDAVLKESPLPAPKRMRKQQKPRRREKKIER